MKTNDIIKHILLPVCIIVIVFLLIEKDDNKVQVTEEEVWEAMDIPEYEAPDVPKSEEPQEDGSLDVYYNDIDNNFLLMADGINKVAIGIGEYDNAYIQEGIDSIMFSSNEIYKIKPPTKARDFHRKAVELAQINESIAIKLQADLDSGTTNYLMSDEFIQDLDEAMRINDEMNYIRNSTEGVNSL